MVMAHFGMSPEALGKCDPRLKREIERCGPEVTAELPILMRLAQAVSGSPSGQANSAEQREAAFTAETEDLVDQLVRGDARDIQRFWINRTVAARAKIATIREIAERPDVAEILMVVRHKALI